MNNVSRKDFLVKSALGLAGAAFMPAAVRAELPDAGMQEMKNKNEVYRLKNVRLETGFEYEGDQVVATKTELFCVEFADGKIRKVGPNLADSDAFDAAGWLMLPHFKDMHIHLDKTYYAENWKAIKPRTGGVKAMIALEQQILPEMLEKSTYKAGKLIELLQSHGTGFARSHVNIEPTSKLQSLKNLQLALENKKDVFGAELVAFPQHGVYYTDSVPYLKEAAQMDIDFIGGVDPYTIDGNIERVIDFTVQLALDHQKGIDIHLHEGGETGLQTVEYLIRKVNENPVLKNKTYVSHAFVLAKLDKAKQEEVAEELGAAGVGIVSTIPFGNTIMPVPLLLKHGVNVMTGNDSIVDHWNTFGTGSVLQKASLAAQLYGFNTEFGLSRILKLATAGVLPLDDKGKQQWPKAGDEASILLVDASCSAEAVSRVSPVKSLFYKGNKVY